LPNKIGSISIQTFETILIAMKFFKKLHVLGGEINGSGFVQQINCKQL